MIDSSSISFYSSLQRKHASNSSPQRNNSFLVSLPPLTPSSYIPSVISRVLCSAGLFRILHTLPGASKSSPLFSGAVQVQNLQWEVQFHHSCVHVDGAGWRAAIPGGGRGRPAAVWGSLRLSPILALVRQTGLSIMKQSVTTRNHLHSLPQFPFHPFPIPNPK